MEKNLYTGMEIAVIGMSGKFPGASDVDAFWQALCNGEETLSRFSAEELRDSGVAESLIGNPSYIPVKGVIDSPELFDADFFGYTFREAQLMDPQIRLLHECAWHALEHAGYDSFRYQGRIGIYAGATSNPLWHALALESDAGGLAQLTADKEYICSRIAHKLNLRGPAVFVQTACSTSLVSIHMACRALLTNDCDMALAGGISLSLPHKVGYLYQEGMIGASDGHCRAFDAAADGMVGGEGYGLVVLKQLKKALRDGDSIHAVIRATAINNDGNNKTSFAAPSSNGQASAMHQAHTLGKIDPNTLGLVEAHGTGTYIGDPVEVRALRTLFATGYTPNSCALGSVKSNMGHLDHAAGVASFIKAVLCLKHQKIPPTLHFKNPNPELKLEASPFFVNSQLMEWHKPANHNRRAAVNSLGIGGTNAYAILEEFAEEFTQPEEARPWQLLIISAKSRASLVRAQARLDNFLRSDGAFLNLQDIAFTLREGRGRFQNREVFLCSSAKNIESGLGESLGYSEAIETGHTPVLMFPGQGTQYINMSRGLYDSIPYYKNLVDECFGLLEKITQRDYRAFLFEESLQKDLTSNTEIAQPILFIVEYCLAQLLSKCGIVAKALIGHSLGEFVAACIAGIFSLQDALFIVANRGKLMQSIESGKMVSIRMSEQELIPYLNDNLSIAAVNSPLATVVAGDTEAIVRKMDDLGVRHVTINATHAFHSHMVDCVLEEFRRVLAQVDIGKPNIPIISNVTGDWMTEALCSREYWVEHMRKPVRFHDGLSSLMGLDNPLFIEVGPGNVLSRLVKQHPNKSGKVVTTCRDLQDEKPDLYIFMKSLGQIWAAGLEIDLSEIESRACSRVALPGYEFERKSYPSLLLNRKKLFISEAPAEIDLEPVNLGSSIEGNISEDISMDQETLAVINAFKQTLGLVDVEDDADFFELGGDSYTAMSVIARVHKSAGVLIPLATFYDKPRVSDLSTFIKASVKTEYNAITAAEKSDRYPLSPAQLRLYIVQQVEKDNIGYNESLEIFIDGKLDKNKLEHAFKKLIERHEAFRTSFQIIDAEVHQVIDEEISFNIEYYKSDRRFIDTTLNRFIRPFNLAQAPLFRVALIEMQPDSYLLAMDFHHIIIDGVAMSVVYDELIALYAGDDVEDLSIHYKDFAVWQTQPSYRKQIESQKTYWLDKYQNKPIPELNFPTDYMRPPLRTFAGGTLYAEIEPADAMPIKEFNAMEKTSLFMTLISVLYVMLGIISGSRDISIGTVVAGRRHSALEKIVGVFVNMLALRNSPLPTLSFQQFLHSVKSDALQAFENQEYQYEDLIQELDLPRDPSRNSIFDVAFVLQNMAEIEDGSVTMGDVQLTPYLREKGISKFDLTLTVVEASNHKLFFKWDYSTNLYSRQSIEEFSRIYFKILRSVVEDPSVIIGEIDISDGNMTAKNVDTIDLAEWVI